MKTCCIFNYAPHYRSEIYEKMKLHLDCDFFFGTSEDGKIQKMDYNLLNPNITELSTTKFLGKFSWINNSIGLSFRNYSKFILTGEPFCLSSWGILIINMILGKKTFLWTHGWYGNESLIKKLLKKIYFGLSSGVFLYGQYAKKLMIKEGFDPQKLTVIYNSLDYDAQIKIRGDLQVNHLFEKIFGNGDPVLTFTGRITKEKKLDLLIHAVKLLVDQSLNVNVLILGDGPEKNMLINLVKDLGIYDHFNFYGECYDEMVIADIYFNSTCCVSPGNVGLTGIHAMTYGCPVISHNNFAEQMPEFEIIDIGRTGYFYKQDDVFDLTDKIKMVLNGEREVFRENCMAIVDQYFNTNYQILTFNKVINE